YYGIAQYQMGFILGLKAFSAAVLGGIGNLAGAMLGGVLLGLIEALGAGYVGDLTNLCQLSSWSDAIAERCVSDPNLTLFGSNYQDVFAFLVLIAVLIFRPSGLLGARGSERAWSRRARPPRSEEAPARRVDRHRVDRGGAGRAAFCVGRHRDCVGAHHQSRHSVRPAGARPQHRRRLRRPARPRLHRVLRGGRVYLCAARLAAFQLAPALLDHPADRRRGGLLLRRDTRRADLEAAWRLPRDRHAGLRRDRSHLSQ